MHWFTYYFLQAAGKMIYNSEKDLKNQASPMYEYYTLKIFTLFALTHDLFYLNIFINARCNCTFSFYKSM